MRQDYKDYLNGLRAITPVLPACIPFGLVAGAIAAQMNFSAAAGIAQGFVIFAGAAQLASNQFMTADNMALIAILTGLVVNLRLAMYSAAIAPHFKGLSTRYRAVLAYFLTDQSFAVCITRYITAEADGVPMNVEAKARFYLSGAILNWGLWCVSVASGFYLGAGVPPSWSLDFFVPLTFLALLVPALRDWPGVAAALTGGIVAVLAHALPFNLGLFLGALCGIWAGYVLQTRRIKQASFNQQERAR